MDLSISETFLSIQGEGPNIGRPSVFLRLARCNQCCSFCDTPYTWRFDENLPHRSDKVYERTDEIFVQDIYSVFSQLRRYSANHLVITGGEPLLQQPGLIYLLELLTDNARPWSIEFETAGTIVPMIGIVEKPNVSFVVSPKLANSGNALHIRRRPKALEAFVKLNSSFKFVVCNETDFDEIDEIVREYAIPTDRVFVMGEGIDAGTLSKHTADIIQPAINRGYRVTTRLQIYAFGNRRRV